MALAKKHDSNMTGLRIAEEASFRKLPENPVWLPYEPNEYDSLGGTVTTVARNPINQDRQRKKGVVTDLDATAGFSTDLTQTNMEELLQGFMFATTRRSKTVKITGISVRQKKVTVAEARGIYQGSIIRFSGMNHDANDGFVGTVLQVKDKDLSIAVDGLAQETISKTDSARIIVVGQTFGPGSLSIAESEGGFPAIVFADAVKIKPSELGLEAGDWIYVGGDKDANRFENATNNGFKQLRSVEDDRIIVHKSDRAMSDDKGADKSISIFFGHRLKNETGDLIKRRSYQLERTLGAPDNERPDKLQAEYIVGAVANELTVSVPMADKLTLSLAFIGADSETRSGGLKEGIRPGLVEAAAFNTSSDFSRIRLSRIVSSETAPAPLFDYTQDVTLTINNNVTPNKAVGVLGAFDLTAGTFEVSGSLTPYFTTVEAMSAVRNNEDITFDQIIVKENAGIVMDMPLIALGGGQAEVTQDEPITVPLTLDAASGAKVAPGLNYTLGWTFFDYLPDAAAQPIAESQNL